MTGTVPQSHVVRVAFINDVFHTRPRQEKLTVGEFADRLGCFPTRMLMKVRGETDFKPTDYASYHQWRSERKDASALARVAKASGKSDEAKALKAIAKELDEKVLASKNGLSFLPYVYKDGTNDRFAKSVELQTLVVLDVESGLTHRDVADLLSDYEYVLYSSFSHTPTDVRFRVVLFPERELTVSEGIELTRRIDAHFPSLNPPSKPTFAIDEVGLKDEQLYYLPSWIQGHPEKPTFIHHHGKFLGVDAFPLTPELQAKIEERVAAGDAEKKQRVAATREKLRVAPDTASATVVERNGKWYLSPTGELETKDGWITVRDITSKISGVTCPIHGDTNGSEFVDVSKKTGNPFLICKVCGTVWMDNYGAEADEDAPLKLWTRKKKPVVEQAPQGHPDVELDVSPESAALRASHRNKPAIEAELYRVSERYLEETITDLFPVEGVVYIRSPKGTGKTERIADVVTANRVANRSTVLIGHRIHLLRSLSGRTGLDNYQDQPDGELSAFSAVCLNSLSLREPLHGEVYDTVIIDESEQVFQTLLSEHLSGRDNKGRSILNEVFLTLYKYLSRARLIICLDADITSELTFAVITQLRQPDEHPRDKYVGIINDFKAGEGRTTRMYEDRHHLLHDAIVDAQAGEQIFYALNSRERAHHIAEILRHVTRDDGKPLRVLTVSSETGSSDEVQAFIRSPATEAIKYDCVVSSPTLSTGISIDAYWVDVEKQRPQQLVWNTDTKLLDTHVIALKRELAREADALNGQHHFTRVYGEFGVTVGTYQDADQALCRVRDESVEHRVWMQANKPDITSRHESEILDEIITRELGTLKSATFNPMEAKVTLSKLHRRWAYVYAAIKTQIDAWSIHKPAQFRKARLAQGWTVIDEPLDKIAAADGKNAFNTFKPVGEDHAKAVFHAETIGREEYDMLVKTRNKTREERLSIEKYRYQLELTKISLPFSEENVQKAIEQKLLPALRFARKQVVEDTDGRRISDTADRARNTSTFTSNHHDIKKNELLIYLCDAAGLNWHDLHRQAQKGPVQVSAHTLEKVALAFVERQKECNLYYGARIKDPMKVAVAKDGTTSFQNHAKVWNATIGKHTLPLSSSRVVVAGRKVTVNYIDHDAVSLILDNVVLDM